ncbi:hypothetical protein GE061_011664 [Apolygus lucorum]|uniref:Uncharacterized protein n=1 Tax=Apolygus lucorum TaxID=248454 RepID=A0A8S9Y0S6_APOLU|nr:hypothetical protein GE061_011664 [Apolygus lucorum]
MGDSTVRRVLRGVFTREANQLRDLLNSSADLEQHELKARMLALSSRYDKIKMVDNAILLAIESDPQVNDCELESQYEGIGDYCLKMVINWRLPAHRPRGADQVFGHQLREVSSKVVPDEYSELFEKEEEITIYIRSYA